MDQPPKQPPSPAVAELKAINEDLGKLREDFDEFRKSLSLSIALGIIGAVIALGIIWVVLVVIITQIR